MDRYIFGVKSGIPSTFLLSGFFQEVTVMGYSTMFLFEPGVETLFRSFGGLQLGGRKTSSLSCHLISYKLEGLVR